MTDWNWFFSSMAQSVAALVGVLGAFFVSMLLAEQTSFANDSARTKEIIERAEGLVDRAEKRDFAWYCNRTLDEGLENLRTHIEDDFPRTGTAEDYYPRLGISRFVPRDEAIQDVAKVISEERERIAKRERSHGLPAIPIGSLVRSDVRLSQREQLDRERQAINQLTVDVRANARAAKNHLNRIRPINGTSGTLRVVLLTLIVLFWTGVVVPLIALPVVGSDPGAIAAFRMLAAKYLLLGFVAAVFSTFLWLIWRKVALLKPSADDIDALERWSDPSEYSPYFKVCVEQNGQEL